MILKISYVQNKSNPTYRGLVEVDTNNYPQLNNLSEALVIGYITNNGQNMNPTTNGYTSLKEQLMSQPIVTSNPPFTEHKWWIVYF